MIQTIEKEDDFDEVRNLRIHDLLRDLAIHEAVESNLTILSKEGVRQKTKGTSRRATIQDLDLELLEYTGPNLRSLLCFNSENLKPKYSGFRLLKVLSFMDVVFCSEDRLDWLKELIHLRYLGFIDCGRVPKLPDDIGNCKNLQTLYIIGGSEFDLPVSMWSIKALRHVILREINLCALPSSADLTNLLTLIGTQTTKSWMIGLPRVTNLRTLLLVNTTVEIPWKVVANFLCELNHIISLRIFGKNLTMDILDTRKFPSYENIQVLKLTGKWSDSVALDAGMFPLHITKLLLSGSQFEQDPMPELEKLESLRVLVLGYKSFVGKEMTCSAGGFRRLHELTMVMLHDLEYWTIEENSMPMLNKLKLSECSDMRMLPDLQHVPTLRKLELVGMPSCIKSRVQNEDSHKIELVPLIEIKGRWVD